MAYHQREIVLIEFPYSSMKLSKTRPALIISNDRYNETQQDCLLVSLTTQIKPAKYLLTLKADDFETGGLLRPSSVRFDRINSIAQSNIQRVVAKVKPEYLGLIKNKITQLID